MAEVIRMPKLSDTMEEGVVASWVKKEGDAVEEGDLIAEIETDKATMEYEAPVDGTILKLIVGPGGKCAVGSPIAVFGEKGESFDDSILESTSSGSAASSDPKPQASAAPAPELKVVEAAPSSSAPISSLPVSSGSGGRVKASPLARKIADEKGISLASIQGSGPKGRIVMRDVEGAQPGPAAQPWSAVGIAAQDRDVPASMMRQTIAKRLHAAKNEAPHFYLTRSCDMSAVMKWRARLNKDVEKNPELPKVSVNDIVMMATAKALRKHPDCNASWQGESIREFGAVHMAMAVALPSGLITPVVKNCDQLGIRDIARASRELAIRAKDGQLAPEEYQGGTFTVSNLGMFGIESFTAIINPPQAGILAVGATNKVPWVNEAGDLVVAQRMNMTMSCDHRVIDGAMGAKFLQTLVSFLDDPMMMLA